MIYECRTARSRLEGNSESDYNRNGDSINRSPLIIVDVSFIKLRPDIALSMVLFYDNKS